MFPFTLAVNKHLNSKLQTSNPEPEAPVSRPHCQLKLSIRMSAKRRRLLRAAGSTRLLKVESEQCRMLRGARRLSVG
jgi:hypothetical protein